MEGTFHCRQRRARFPGKVPSQGGRQAGSGNFWVEGTSPPGRQQAPLGRGRYLPLPAAGTFPGRGRVHAAGGNEVFRSEFCVDSDFKCPESRNDHKNIQNNYNPHNCRIKFIKFINLNWTTRGSNLAKPRL